MLCGVSLRFHWYNKLVLYLIGVKVLKFSFSNLYQNSIGTEVNALWCVTKIPLVQQACLVSNWCEGSEI